MRISKGLLAISALAALAGAPAQALTQVSLNGSNFQLVLRDLNTADGTAPSLSWLGGGAFSLSSLEQVQTGWQPVQTDGSRQWTQAAWGNIDSRGYYGSYPSVSAVSALGNGHQSGSMNALGLDTLALDFTAQPGHKGQGTAIFTRDFTLSAGSEVSFSYELNASLMAAGYSGPWQPGAVEYDWRAGGSFSAFMSAGGHQATVINSVNSPWSDPGFPLEASWEGQILSLTLKNPSAVARNFTLSIGTNVWAMETVTPVPEPATYALMALGLVGVGLAARRRKPA